MTVVMQPPIPAGVIHQYAGASAPAGYLMCDGSAVSRTTYADLFAAIGTTYGSGNGSTTFTLPDLRGRTPVGSGNDGTAANSATRTLGSAGGDTRLQSHGHGVTDPTHQHGPWPGYEGFWQTDVQGGGVVATGPPYYQANSLVGATGFAATGITIQSSGSGSGENMPPFVVVNHIIKT